MKKSILSSLEENAERVFLYEENRIWTYRELKEFIIKFSYYIRANNIKSVVISLPKSFYTYAIIITCYLTGVTYCVNNENDPKQRKNFIYLQIQPDLIIGNIDKNEYYNFTNLEDLIIALKVFQGQSDICTDYTEIIYISFTSGSTGIPKGCRITTEALEKHIKYDIELFKFTCEDIIGQFVPLYFDMSVLDIYASIIVGCAIVKIDGGDKFRFGKIIQKYKITFLNIVPQVVDIMLKAEELTREVLRSVRMIRFGGDKVFKSKAKLLFCIKPDLLLVSTYGPTETTMFSTSCVINESNLDELSTNILSIGKPIKGSKIVLYNIENEVGEIVIYGDYVGKGYLGSNQSGFEEIIVNKCRQKVYFTGDYAKKIGDYLYFEGRRDQQIKKDGNRINLIEIETAIKMYIKNECAVVYNNNMIICYIEKMEDINLDKREIFEFLQGSLPHYALPNKIVFIDEIPHNSNGKIDYNQLKLKG